MGAVLLIELVGAGEDNLAAVLDLGRPLVIFPFLEAVDQDGAGFVGKVELHIILAGAVGAGLEGTHLTGKPVVGGAVGLDEIGYGSGGDFGLGFHRLAIEAVDIGSALAGGFGGGVVQRDRTVDDYFVTHLHVVVTGLPLAAAQIVHLEGFEVVGGSLTVVGDEEDGVAVGTTVGKGGLHLVNLALDVVALGGHLAAFQIGVDPGIGLTGAPGSLGGFAVTGSHRATLGNGNGHVAGHTGIDLHARFAVLAAVGCCGKADGGITGAAGGIGKQPVLGVGRNVHGPGLTGSHLNGGLAAFRGELKGVLVGRNAVHGLLLLAGQQKGASGQNS